MRLHAYSDTRWDADPFVARITTNHECEPPLRSREALLLPCGKEIIPDGFAAYLAFNDSPITNEDQPRIQALPRELEYLTDSDIIYVDPRSGLVSVIYRRHAHANTITLTDQCNCNCIMCPQPPRGQVDDHWIKVWARAIPLMSQETPELVITGGEPSLLPDGLLELISTCQIMLPQTALHVLSNGRMFNYLSLCRKLAETRHPDLMLGIPLYSDLSYLHDYIVQTEGAFDQTLRGIMNLERCGLRVEIRVVMLRQNIDRLVELASFIARNLPFVHHVALMGLEPMGYATTNWHEVWIDPADYQPALAEAVDELVRNHLHVSIYNHQLCVLDERLWRFARKSISDWKTVYFPACEKCQVHSDCGGFFASAHNRHSRAIHSLERQLS